MPIDLFGRFLLTPSSSLAYDETEPAPIMPKCKDFGGRYCDGRPCEREVAPGFTACPTHSAMKNERTPSLKFKSQQALAGAVMPAIEGLHTVLNQYMADACPSCGYPKKDAEETRLFIVTCKTILDRTGFGRTLKMELTSQSDGDIDVALLNDSEREQLIAHLAEVKRLKAMIRARQQARLSPTAAPVRTVDPPIPPDRTSIH
jgi:hypothetical protein